MSICNDCDIEEKIAECCGSNPETGESALLTLYTGDIVEACPNLNADGYCMDYKNRPGQCSSNQCYKINEMDLVDLMNY